MFKYTVEFLNSDKIYNIEANSFKIVGDTIIFLKGKHPDTMQIAAFPTGTLITSVYLGDTDTLPFMD